jgi:hypothetical protein
VRVAVIGGRKVENDEPRGTRISERYGFVVLFLSLVC